MSQFILNGVKITFMNLFEKIVIEESNAKHRATFLIKRDDEKNLALIKQEMSKITQVQGEYDVEKTCFLDGAGDKFKEKAHYHGYFVFRAGTEQDVHLFYPDKTRISDESVIEDGAYVNALVSFWAQKKHGRRLNANLHAVQFIRAGDPFWGVSRKAALLAFDEHPDVDSAVNRIEPVGDKIIGPPTFDEFDEF